jgi:hypothetical protein
MPRYRSTSASSTVAVSPFGDLTLFSPLVESLGEAIGRGVARGLNVGLGGSTGAAPPPSAPGESARRRGRPPKAQAVAADRRCKVEGCTNEVRSKGLCSKHYQAERRRLQTEKA